MLALIWSLFGYKMFALIWPFLGYMVFASIWSFFGHAMFALIWPFIGCSDMMFASIWTFLGYMIFASIWTFLGYMIFALILSSFGYTMFALIWPILGCAMFALICSFFAWKEQLPSPPPITITGVRIPADGTPFHLLSLTTISTTSVSGATDSFLLHVPDLRQYWKTELAWGYRDIRRLDLYSQNPLQQHHYLRQKNRLKQQYRPQQRLYLSQRNLLPQQYHPLQQHYSACIGAY
jgi:hypothetical protein